MSTIMRTMSTLQTSLTGRRRVAELGLALSNAGKEATTGLKADVYRSLGLQSGEAMALRARRGRVESFVASNTLLANKMVMTAHAMSTMRETAQTFLNQAVSSRDSLTQSAAYLQTAAKTAIEQLTTQLNSSFDGTSLFSGTMSDRTPLQVWDAASAATGLSPRGVVEGVIGAGITSAADATAKAAELKMIFDSADTVTPARNFEGTFFNGTPLQDPLGAASSRLTARIDEGVVLNYGVQANDPAFTELFRGLSMIAGTDVNTITDPAAYAAWMKEAVDTVAGGISRLTAAEQVLGSQQQSLDLTLASQETQVDIYANQVLALEGIDAFEAASRVNLLQTQMEATYAVTARLSRLTFLNYM